MANAIAYEGKVMAITEIDFSMGIGLADVIWNGNEYKVVYSASDQPNWLDEQVSLRKIKWATIDESGNLVEVKTLIENENYSVQNPTIIFTGLDYILLWIEADPNNYFKKLHATIIDEYGNLIYDKIISPYIGTKKHPYTYEYGAYSAVWDDTEEFLYVVYAEGNPRLGYGWPHKEKLIFTKLYMADNKLDFVIFKDGYKLVKQKLLYPAMTFYTRICLVKANNYLALAAQTNNGSLLPFVLLDVKGNKLEENYFFNSDISWPTLYWNGENIILGHFYNSSYKIDKLSINENNNGFDLVFVEKSVYTDIGPLYNPILLMKGNTQLSLVWKGEINQDKALYGQGYNVDLESLFSEKSLKPPYISDLEDYYLIDGTGNNSKYALVLTNTYIATTCYLILFDFEPGIRR